MPLNIGLTLSILRAAVTHRKRDVIPSVSKTEKFGRIYFRLTQSGRLKIVKNDLYIFAYCRNTYFELLLCRKIIVYR